MARWGRVDILFNNAGYAQVKLVEDTTEAEWDHLLAVNLKSVFFGVKYVVPVMRRQGGGVILNMGSISGLVGQMLTPGYVASKGAVVMLTKSLALDYGGDNIRVNCLCPGITDTPAFREHISSSADPEALIRERQDARATRPLSESRKTLRARHCTWFRTIVRGLPESRTWWMAECWPPPNTAQPGCPRKRSEGGMPKSTAGAWPLQHHFTPSTSRRPERVRKVLTLPPGKSRSISRLVRAG